MNSHLNQDENILTSIRKRLVENPNIIHASKCKRTFQYNRSPRHKKKINLTIANTNTAILHRVRELKTYLSINNLHTICNYIIEILEND